MTFTEAALEVLRRVGKPLHFKEITTEAITAGLLSHVGQTPEATMGARLLSMARREHDRRVTAIEPGVFALVEWGINNVDHALDPAHVTEIYPEAEPAYRPKERHPQLQDEYVAGGRRSESRRKGDEEEGGKKKKKYAPPAEVAHQWLRESGQPATLAELVQALREQDKIAEALERDLASFEKALQEENRRRTDSRRPLLFRFEQDGRVVGLEVPKEQPREKPARPEKAPPVKKEEAPRPMPADEQRRNTIRSVRRRIGSLDTAALERLVTVFLEATGYRELNMARRTKEGPLYLARHRWGAGELRYAVRVVKPGRDLSRQDVQDLRRDVSHFSAQLGIVIGSGECSREAKSEANAASNIPVMLYGGESLAEALVDAGLGVTKRLIEWLEYDEEFFISVGASAANAPAEAEAPAAPPAPASAEPEKDERRRQRERRRDRRERQSDSRNESTAPTTEEEPKEEPKETQLSMEWQGAGTDSPQTPETVEEPTVEGAPTESLPPAVVEALSSESLPAAPEIPPPSTETPAVAVESESADPTKEPLSSSEVGS